MLLPAKEQKLREVNNELANTNNMKEATTAQLRNLNVELFVRRRERVAIIKQVEEKEKERGDLDRGNQERKKMSSELDGFLQDKEARIEEIVERARANLLYEASVLIKTEVGILPSALRAVMQALRRNGRFRSILITLAEQGFDPNKLDWTTEIILTAFVDETYRNLMEEAAKRAVNSVVPASYAKSLFASYANLPDIKR